MNLLEKAVGLVQRHRRERERCYGIIHVGGSLVSGGSGGMRLDVG